MKDALGNNQCPVAFGDHGQIEPVTDGRDSEACISRLRERCRMTKAEAEELVEEVMESFGGDPRGEVMKEFWRIHSLEDRLWIKYQTYVKNNGDRDLAFRCCLMLLGYQTSAGADSQRALVKLLSEQYGEEVTKAAVNKCLKYFKKKLPELPYFSEQRSKEARKRMSDKRNNQLKT